MSVYSRRGLVVRLIYLTVALGAWVTLVMARALAFRRGETVVLCYHGITEEQRARFACQMAWIARRTVDVADISERTRVPRRAWQPRVGITFDDGFDCIRDNALPILHRYGIPATVFPVTGNLANAPRWKIAPGRADARQILMSADQIRAVAQDFTCRFGSHTRWHLNLPRALPATIRHELEDSKTHLEQLLGRPVEDLALPHGAYTRGVLDRAFGAGYKRVFTLDPEVVAPGRPRAVIGRFSMSPDAWPIEFRLTCAGAYAWLGIWRRGIHRLRQAIAPRLIRELSSAWS